MSPSLDLLLTHYRHELAELLLRVSPEEAPVCPAGEELLWAEAGEVEGWLPLERAMEVRRVAARLRFYEQRAEGHIPR
jgi:hypothetical protein